MLAIDIRRKVENWLAAELNEGMAARTDGLPPLPAFPALGGGVDAEGNDAAAAAATPVGPYIGVRVVDAEERLRNDLSTWAVQAEVILIANAADVAAPEHAKDARVIHDILVAVQRSVPGWYEPMDLNVSGLEVTNGADYIDAGDQTNGAALKLAIGCTG